MARNFDITSANAQVYLTADTVFPSGIQLEQFSADASFSADAVDIVETRMGVDGYMAAGYTPNIKTVTVTLEASSPSRSSLNTLWAAMEANRTVYACTMVITLPSIGETITLSDGVLKNGNPLPAGAKTLQPTAWTFDFANINVSKLAS